MPTPIAKTSPQKTIPQRMSRKYILSQCFSSLSMSETNSTDCVIVKPFGVTVGVEDVHWALLVSVQDRIDGELTGNVFHLAARKVVV